MLLGIFIELFYIYFPYLVDRLVHYGYTINMTSSLNIYSGANGQARGGEAGLFNGKMVDPDISAKLSGLDQAPLSMLLGGASAVAGMAAGKVKSLWQKVRAPGASAVADDLAKAGGKASMIRGGANVVTKIAVPVAIAAEVGMRGYESYKIEKRHDSVEDSHNQGLIDDEAMQKVTDERNAGHVRNVAGGVGGFAGAVAGFKIGGAIGAGAGLLTGPGAVVASPVLGFVGGLSGAIAGYYGGSKLAEAGSDMVTGHDSSYKHTQAALDAVRSNELRAAPEAAGKSWAQARERATHQAGGPTPGLSTDPEAQRQFNQTFSASYQIPSGDLASGVGTKSLSRGSHLQVEDRQKAARLARSEF